MENDKVWLEVEVEKGLTDDWKEDVRKEIEAALEKCDKVVAITRYDYHEWIPKD